MSKYQIGDEFLVKPQNFLIKIVSGCGKEWKTKCLCMKGCDLYFFVTESHLDSFKRNKPARKSHGLTGIFQK